MRKEVSICDICGKECTNVSTKVEYSVDDDIRGSVDLCNTCTDAVLRIVPIDKLGIQVVPRPCRIKLVAIVT